MKCPYTTTKRMINYIRKTLSTPAEEYGGYAPCPFAKPELDARRLMLAEFHPASEHNLVHIINEFIDSKFKSLLIAQQFEEGQSLNAKDTKQYQQFINDLLNEMGLTKYKCICFNPNDDVVVRKQAPYFLINIAERKVLAQAHNKMMKTDYFSRMSDKYLKFLHVDPEKVTRKIGS
jgi:hypothetical protein